MLPNFFLEKQDSIIQDIYLLNRDARNMNDLIMSESIDCIIADHPWEDKKSHKGGTRHFASEYDCFRYESSDFVEKARILKEGAFLIELLPEKNANNRVYLREIEDMATKAGFEYFAEVPISGGNSNIGRKKKNIAIAYFFTKGPARKLKIFSEHLSSLSMNGAFKYFKFKKYGADFFKTYYETLSLSKMSDTFERNLSKKEFGCFKNSTEEYLRGAFSEFVQFLSDKKNYKSGTKKILPEFFTGENTTSKSKFQSEKPISVLKDILEQVTNEGEVVLEQFGRSFGGAYASVLTNRVYVGIEIDSDIYTESVNAFTDFQNNKDIVSNEAIGDRVNDNNDSNNTDDYEIESNTGEEEIAEGEENLGDEVLGDKVNDNKETGNTDTVSNKKEIEKTKQDLNTNMNSEDSKINPDDIERVFYITFTYVVNDNFGKTVRSGGGNGTRYLAKGEKFDLKAIEDFQKYIQKKHGFSQVFITGFFPLEGTEGFNLFSK